MDLLLYGLATFRIALLLTRESGPWYVFERLRYLIGVRHDDLDQPYGLNELARGLSCIWCCSVWVGFGWLAVKWLLPAHAPYLAFPFAISSVAILISEMMEK